MYCPICHHDWCWACGLHVNSIVHRLQTLPAFEDDTDDKILICETIVSFLEVNKHQKIPNFLKLMICILGVISIILVTPIILLVMGILVSPICAVYFCYNLYFVASLEKVKRISITVLLTPLLLVLLTAGCVLSFCLYYALASIFSIIYVV